MDELSIVWFYRDEHYTQAQDHGWALEVPYRAVAAPATKFLQSYPTLHDPTDGSPLGSSVPGFLQAKILEWVAITFSNCIETES